MYFKKCPLCGAHLDPGELCDCRETEKEADPGELCDCRETEKEAAPAATGTTSRKWTQAQSISLPAGSQGLEVMPCRTMN